MDVSEKRGIYERNGVREYWLVDPRSRRIEILTLDGGRFLDRKPRRRLGILPGSTIGRLRDRIFREFRLDRFALDVVICRAGDRDRRQLSTTTRLQTYLVEE